MVCLNRIEDAIETMSKAVDLKPDWPLYRCNRAKQYMKLKNWKKALEDFDNVMDHYDTLEAGNGLS